MLDAEGTVFHFIVQYGLHDGVPILLHQQMIAADDLREDQNGIREHWACVMEVQEASGISIHDLEGKPLWIQAARANNIRMLVTIDGQRIAEAEGDLHHGDVIKMKLQVWQKQHMLHILLAGHIDASQEDEIEFTSFLQPAVGTRSRSTCTDDFNQLAYWEICQAVCSGECSHVDGNAEGGWDGDAFDDVPTPLQEINLPLNDCTCEQAISSDHY